jgi:hypothetical protein
VDVPEEMSGTDPGSGLEMSSARRVCNNGAIESGSAQGESGSAQGIFVSLRRLSVVPV